MKWKQTTLFECFHKPGPAAAAAASDDTAETNVTEKEPDANVTPGRWKSHTS